MDFEFSEQYISDVPNVSTIYGEENSIDYSPSLIPNECKIYPDYKLSERVFGFREYGQWSKKYPSYIQKKSTNTSTDFIDVFIRDSVIPTRIEIFETFMPGALVKISACYRQEQSDSPINTRGIRWRTIWSESKSEKKEFRFKTIKEQNIALNKLLIYHHLCGNGFEIDESFLPAELRAILKPLSRVFQPYLQNVPPMQSDLFRLEFNTQRSLNLYQIDAIKISGFRSKSNQETSTFWPREILSLPAPTNLEDKLDEERIIDALLLPNHSVKFSHKRFDPERSLRRSVSIDADIGESSKSNLKIDQDTEPNNLKLNQAKKSSTSIEELVDEDILSKSILFPHNARELQIISPPKLGISALPNKSNLLKKQTKSVNLKYKMKSFEDLPYEVNLKIFKYLDLPDLCKAAVVCKLFYALSNDAAASLTEIDLQHYWATIKAKSLVTLSLKLNRGVLFEPPPNISHQVKVTLNKDRYTDWRRKTVDVNEDIDEVASTNTESDLDYTELYDSQFSISQALSVCRKFSFRKRNVSTSFAHDIIHSKKKETNIKQRSHYLEDNSNATSSSEPSTNMLYRLKSDECAQRLRRLNLSWCGSYNKISPIIFSLFLQNSCRNLVSIRLANCQFMMNDCLLYLVNNCQMIEELDLSSCLEIKPDGFIVLSRLTKLRWLSLYRCNINSNDMKSLSGTCQYLEHLNLGNSLEGRNPMHNDANPHQYLIDIARNNKNLKSLNLSWWKYLSHEVMMEVFNNSPGLIELDLDHCDAIDVAGIVRFLSLRCPRLEKLSLNSFKSIENDDYIGIIENLYNTLTYLDLGNNSSVTDQILEFILTRCNSLNFVNVTGCPLVTDKRIIDFRSKFPACFIQTYFEAVYPYFREAIPITPMSESELLPLPERLALPSLDDIIGR